MRPGACSVVAYPYLFPCACLCLCHNDTKGGPARACNVVAYPFPCACLLLLFAVKQVQGGCEHLCVRYLSYTETSGSISGLAPQLVCREQPSTGRELCSTGNSIAASSAQRAAEVHWFLIWDAASSAQRAASSAQRADDIIQEARVGISREHHH